MFKHIKDVTTLSVDELEKLATKGHKEAKKELARRLIEGEGTDKNEAKAVQLLEKCVALGDPDSKLMLAKCCALGHGLDQNAERSEVLLKESAKEGNKDAQSLVQLMTECKDKTKADFSSLLKITK